MAKAEPASAFATLRARFAGTLLVPEDPDYDVVRRVHNGLIDKRPAIIARCRNSTDIAAAVEFAREPGAPPFSSLRRTPTVGVPYSRAVFARGGEENVYGNLCSRFGIAQNRRI